MAWTLTTSGASIAKAGANANATIIASGATLLRWSNDVEGQICARTRHDWVSSNATGNYAGMLSECASDLIAMRIIAYDMSGYTSRSEAQTMLDVLNDDANRIINDLKEKTVQEKMGVSE